jgi:hypothetical protein
MRTQELQDAYYPPEEPLTPMRELAITKLRSMMHTYLNGAVPVEVAES